MASEVFDTITCKTLILAPSSTGHGYANMVSGSLFVSGTKLLIGGNASYEIVTSG